MAANHTRGNKTCQLHDGGQRPITIDRSTCEAFNPQQEFFSDSEL